MKKTLIIADDHPLFRNGVRQIVDESGQFDIVAEVGDGVDCQDRVIELRPDCLVLDLNLPGKSGFEVVKDLQRKGALCRFIILSMHSSPDFVQHAREIGCHGFVAKEDTGPELVEILTAAQAGFSVSSSIAEIDGTREHPESELMQDETPDLGKLTPTEVKILAAVGESLTSHQIGKRFNISERTVHTHRQKICKNYYISGPNGLIKFSIENRARLRQLMV